MSQVLKESPTKANQEPIVTKVTPEHDTYSTRAQPGKRIASSPVKSVPQTHRIKIDQSTKGLDENPELWNVAFQGWMATKEKQRCDENLEFLRIEAEFKRLEKEEEEESKREA